MSESPQNREEPVPEGTADKVIVQAAQWAGPLPPPAALEHFERVIPGGAERILRMAEIEQSHRIDNEQKSLRAGIADTRLGKYLGTAITVLAIIAALVVVYLRGPWQVAVAFVGVPVLTAVRALIRGGRDGSF